VSRLGLSFRYHPTPGSPACNAQCSYNPRSYDFSESRETAFEDMTATLPTGLLDRDCEFISARCALHVKWITAGCAVMQELSAH
jgi:hypothetical protein